MKLSNMEGATQFILWWKIVELIDHVSAEFLSAFRLAESDTTNIASAMVRHLNRTINHIWERYPHDLLVSHFHREALLQTIGTFPDAHRLRDFSTPEALEGNPAFSTFTEAFRALKPTTLNSILRNLNIDEIADAGWQDRPESYEQHAFDDAAHRFDLVYIYVFCAAGTALVLMELLHLLSQPPRLAMMAAQKGVALGVVLLGGVSRHQTHTRFMATPWIIPSICLVLLVILVVIHGSRWVPLWRSSKGGSATTSVRWTEPQSEVEGVRDTGTADVAPSSKENKAYLGFFLFFFFFCWQ
jgi:hypothetical protein